MSICAAVGLAHRLAVSGVRDRRFAGESISFAYHIAIVLGIASLAVAFSIEVLSRETETRAKLLLLEKNSSAAEIAELREKIRELDRLLSSASEENDDFRRNRLLERIHEVQSSLSGATSKTVPSQLDA